MVVCVLSWTSSQCKREAAGVETKLADSGRNEEAPSLHERLVARRHAPSAIYKVMTRDGALCPYSKTTTLIHLHSLLEVCHVHVTTIAASR